MYLDRLFKLMADKQASDLFISCGAPINIKINGIVQPVSTQPMDPETVRRIAYELMSSMKLTEQTEIGCRVAGSMATCPAVITYPISASVSTPP